MRSYTIKMSSPAIASALNAVLKNELAAINQYFLHARMLKHLGFMKLADVEYRTSIDEMKHADQLVELLLSLGGTPNMQELGALYVGETVRTILECDLKREESVCEDLASAIKVAQAHGDQATETVLTLIQTREAEHTNFIRTQLDMIDSMGEDGYTKTQV